MADTEAHFSTFHKMPRSHPPTCTLAHILGNTHTEIYTHASFLPNKHTFHPLYYQSLSRKRQIVFPLILLHCLLPIMVERRPDCCVWMCMHLLMPLFKNASTNIQYCNVKNIVSLYFTIQYIQVKTVEVLYFHKGNRLCEMIWNLMH